MRRVALLMVVVASCYRDAPVAPPPTARFEVTIERPGFAWVHGHYVRDGDGYRWRRGHYVRERADYVFVEGRWERRATGYVWIEGRWRRRADVTIR